MLIELVEGGPAQEYARVPDTVLRDLVQCPWVSVSRGLSGNVEVKATTFIGSARVGDIELHVAPKVPIARLLFMLGYAANDKHWQESDVGLHTVDSLVAVIAEVYARLAERATAQGLLQGYRTVEDSLPVVCGKILVKEQLRRRFQMPLPVEVAFDEYDIDIPENQILKTATATLLRLPDVRPQVRSRLLHLHRLLIDVSRLPDSRRRPHWARSRLNTRYQPALAFAELVLDSLSVEAGAGDAASHGFMINMASLYESFLGATLSRELVRQGGGRTRTQARWTLDDDATVPVRPDITWHAPDSDRIADAVIDAKYKAEKPSGYPNADLYQMLAYCTVAGLSEGHLVYAKGDATPGARVVRNAGVTLYQHALDLDVEPEALLAQVRRIATRVLAKGPAPQAE